MCSNNELDTSYNLFFVSLFRISFPKFLMQRDHVTVGCHLLKFMRITRSQLKSYIVRTIEWVHRRGSYLRFIAIRQFLTQKKKTAWTSVITSQEVLPSSNWQETTSSIIIIFQILWNWQHFFYSMLFVLWIVTHLGFVSKIKSQNHLILEHNRRQDVFIPK